MHMPGGFAIKACIQKLESEGYSGTLYEPRCEKTGLRGFRPGPTQIGLYSFRIWLRGLKFRIKIDEEWHYPCGETRR